MVRNIKMSLAEWMINNLGDDSIDKYWSDKNEISPWDISHGSHKKVWIKCQNTDYHYDYEVIVKNFTINNSNCPYCRGMKVHPRDSFAQWGIDTYGEDFLDEFWSDKNIISPWSVSVGSKKTIFIKCEKVNYHDYYETNAYSFVMQGYRCTFCSGRKVHPKDSFAQWCIDNVDKNFIEKYWSNKNKINPYSIAQQSHIEIYIKCQNKDYHDDYKTTPNRFFYQGNGCATCSHKFGKVHPLDSLGTLYPETVIIWSDKNNFSPFEYAHMSNKIVYWRCKNGKHKDYERSIDSSTRFSFRCPTCVQERDESILQEKVRLFLTQELHYEVNHEYSCNLKCINPKTNFQLPYDNEVIVSKSIKLIVEVNGQHHYDLKGYNALSAMHKGTTPQEELNYIKWKDEFKKEFAFSNGYYFLAIPYWTDNDQEEWKDLILSKLKEIN